MATKTNVQKAAELIESEGVKEFESNDELAAYIAEVDAVIEAARGVKKAYAKKLAVLASQRSREARKERVAKALKLLEEHEANA